MFDHIGHIPGLRAWTPRISVLRRLIDGADVGKAVVTYDNTTDGPAGYADVIRWVSFVKAAPDGLSGQNWPIPTDAETG